MMFGLLVFQQTPSEDPLTSALRQQRGVVRTKTAKRSELTPSPTTILIPRTWETTRRTVTELNLLI